MAVDVGAIVVRINGETYGLTKAVKEAESRLMAFGQKAKAIGMQMRSVGQTMTRRITMPMLAIGAISTKFAMDFEKAFEFANTMMKLGAEEAGRFKTAVLDMSDTYGKSAADILRSSYRISSVLHTNTEDTLTMLDAVTKGAKAGKISVEDTTNAVVRTMSIYGIKIKDTMKLVDLLAATVEAGDATWQDMAENLTNVEGITKTLGISLEEAASAFAAISSKAGNASEATTAYRGVLLGLTKPSEEMTTLLKNMGDGYDSAQAAIADLGFEQVLQGISRAVEGNALAMGKLFPRVRGIIGMAGFGANKGLSLAEAFDRVANSVGETQRQIDAGHGDYAKFIKAVNKLKNDSIRLGATLIPIVTKIVNGIHQLAKKWNTLSDEEKKSFMKWAGAAALAGPLLTALGNITTALGVATLAWGKFAKEGRLAMAGKYGVLTIEVLIVGALVKKHFEEAGKLGRALKTERETKGALEWQLEQLEKARASASPEAITNLVLGRNPKAAEVLAKAGGSIGGLERVAAPDVLSQEQIAINEATAKYEQLIKDINYDFLTNEQKLLSLVEKRRQLELDIAGAKGLEALTLKSEAARTEADMLNILSDIKNQKDGLLSEGAMRVGAAEKGSLEAYQTRIGHAQRSQKSIEKNTANMDQSLKHLVELAKQNLSVVETPAEIVDF